MLILSAWYPTKIQTSGIFVKDQAEALAKAGHKVSILVVSYFSLSAWLKRLFSKKKSIPEPCEFAELVPVNCIFYLPIRFFRDQNLYMKNTIIRQVKRRMKRYASEKGIPDLLHHHCLSDYAYLTESLSEMWNKPYVFTEHSPYRSDEQLNKFNRFETKEDRTRFVQNAFQRIAVSEYWAKIYEGIYRSKYLCVSNLVNRVFELDAERDQHKGFTFVCVAFLDKQKNHKSLITAFELKFKGIKDVQLELAGTGPMLAELKEFTKQKGLTDQIRFHGNLSRENLVQLLDRSDAFVLASHYETFGIAIVEAMFRGLPVVCTACGGPEEFIHAGNGLLARLDDTNDLAEQMEQMVQNRSQYDSKQIAAEVRKRFSETEIVNQLQRIYVQAVNT